MKRTDAFRNFLLLLTVAVINSCSIRDYSNPLLSQHFNGPIISIYSPANNSQIIGSADVSGNAQDISGVSRVVVIAAGTTNEVSNPSLSQNLPFTLTVPFYVQGWQNIVVQAYDKFQIMTSVTIRVDVQVVSPQLTVETPSSLPYHTNQSVLLLAGTSQISTGFISQIRVIRNEDNAVFTVNGLNNWNCSVSLLPNRLNNFTVTAVSDQGITVSRSLQLVQDSTPPQIQWQNLVDGQEVPRDLLVEFSIQDSLSPIRGAIHRIDNLNNITNLDTGYVTWMYPGLTNGPHSLQAQARDWAGNDSVIYSLSLLVNDKIPAIMIYNPGYFTNTTTFSIYGVATVGNLYTISHIALSVNGGAYTPVSFFNNASSSSGWTNTGTVLLANRENTVTVRAVSSENRTNFFTRRFFVDTLAPEFVSLLPLDGSIVANADRFNYLLDIRDSGSGLAGYIQTVGIGGVTNYTHTNQLQPGLQNYSIAGTSDPLTSGGVVTNIITLVDNAWNKAVRTNILRIYPYICVSPTGSDAQGGFFHQPLRSIPLAVQRAVLYGITNIAVFQGLYSPGAGLNDIMSNAGVVIQANNLHLFGGIDPVSGAQTGVSVLDSQSFHKHVVHIRNSQHITLDHFRITGGQADTAGQNYGGGIYAENLSYSTLRYLDITNNSATGNLSRGGGIDIVNGSRLYLEILLFQNVAESGGGLSLDGDSNTIMVQARYNTALSNGGGLLVEGRANIIKGNLTRNYAWWGGGVYLRNNQFTILEATVNSNRAAQGGGAYLAGGSSISLTSFSQFGWNTATNSMQGRGGGVFISGGNNQSIYSLFHHNLSHLGGALYLDNGQDALVQGSYVYNQALLEAGAVYLFGGNTHSIGAQITSNQAPQGGGITLKNGNSHSFLTSASLYRNLAYGAGVSGWGGGIWLTNCDNITIMAQIQENQADKGGGIAAMHADNLLLQSLIKGNTARTWGGGLYSIALSDSTLSGSIINNVSSNAGGGVYLNGWNVDASSLVSNNYVAGNGLGGGYYLQGLAVGDISGTVSFNSAARGGGLDISACSGLDITAIIRINEARVQSGGGISLSASSNITLNCTITGNDAGNLGGGGLYIGTNAYDIDVQGVISNNNSSGAGGGISLKWAGQLNIQAWVAGNNSDTMGGGIAVSASDFITISGTIINNHAFNQGAGILQEQSDHVQILSCVLTNNSASGLNSILHYGAHSAHMTNNTISANIFGGSATPNSVAIYEAVTDLSGHRLQNNAFITNQLWFLYFDPLPSPVYLSPGQINLLNLSTNAHDARYFGGNYLQ